MRATNEKADLYDVLAVNLTTKRVRVLAEGKSEDNAETIVGMTVMRRGVEEEFFTTAPAGTVKEGDVYGGGAE